MSQHIPQSKDSNPTFQKKATSSSSIHISYSATIIHRTRTNPESITLAHIQHTINNMIVDTSLSKVWFLPISAQNAPFLLQEIPEEEEPLCGQDKIKKLHKHQEISEEEKPLHKTLRRHRMIKIYTKLRRLQSTSYYRTSKLSIPRRLDRSQNILLKNN